MFNSKSWNIFLVFICTTIFAYILSFFFGVGTLQTILTFIFIVLLLILGEVTHMNKVHEGNNEDSKNVSVKS